MAAPRRRRASAAGGRVVTAAPGPKPRHLHQATIDLLIVGLELADMHGLLLLQQLERQPPLFDIPTVIVGEPDSPGVADYAAAATVEGVVEQGLQLLAAPPRPVILLVENDPSAAQTLRKILRRAGYACLVASDGVQALEFARARTPQFIVTDFQMPKMDGLAMLQVVRRDPTLGRVPAVMLSGQVTPALIRATGTSPCRSAKPVEREKLLSEIRAQL